MQTYPIPMIPGPVQTPPDVLAAYAQDYGSGDLEPEFVALYQRTAQKLQQLMETRSQVVIHTGEGMLALWAALKNCIRPGERVLAVGTGVFGYGFGDMARQVGAEVRTVGFGYDETIGDLSEVEQAIREFKPKMITVIHCETPSGTLNPLEGLAELKRKYNVPLLVADAVASIGGAPVKVDEWAIDLCLGGSQKALSAPPEMCFLSVSEAAWKIIEEVNYIGYDALLPFRTAPETGFFPYTPSWHGVAALDVAAERILKEGMPAVFARHEAVAKACRDRLAQIGYELFPRPGAVSSPTVTAVKVPEGVEWSELDRKLRARGLAVGGSYGPLAGKVFRLGHMGYQSNLELVNRALDVLEAVRRD